MHAPFNVDSTLPTDRIGCVVWWSADAIRVDPAALRAGLAEHCPEHLDLVRTPLTPAQAMRRAMRRRQGAVTLEGCRWEEVSDGADGLLIALAQSERDGMAREFRASTRFTVLVDHTTGLTVCSRSPEGEMEASAMSMLMDRYSIERGFLTAPDLRNILVKIILGRSAGVRLKEAGAVYFIPAPGDEVIDRLANVTRLAGVELLRFPVSSVDGFSVGQLVASARRGIAEEVEELRSLVAARLKRIAVDGKSGRLDVIAMKLQDAEDLRAKARLYAHLLGAEMDSVLAGVTEAERLCRETETALLARSK